MKMVKKKASDWESDMSERLGHILISQGAIDADKLDFCLNVQKNNGGEAIGKVLKHYDFINEEQIARALAQQVGWDLYEGDYTVDSQMAALLGMDFLREHMVFPVWEKGESAFVMSRTDDMAATDHIQARLKMKVRFYIAPEACLRQALDKFIVTQAACPRIDGELDKGPEFWFDRCLDLAIAKNATDIHIEPSQKAVEVRFRIDGILYFMDSLRLERLPRLVNVIFHRADVTVSDFGHFHDARFTRHHMDRTVDIRVSHIPSVKGSSLVLRLLDKDKAALDLTALGYGNAQWELIRAGLAKPEGITLVVGPTGCGKSTTLYAMLNYLKSISRKIVTIEDPVEMHLSLMTQVQTNDKRSVDFSNTVRAFMRHDPDIILVGEIRDQETAREAVRAAMTGHKVFATLHANRPVDAILRLHDLGVPYANLAGNLTMVIAQRLLRKISPEGGFKGRTVVSEVLSITEDVDGMVGEGAMMSLRKYLKASKEYMTMREDAVRLVDEGVTNIQEVERVLG